MTDEDAEFGKAYAAEQLRRSHHPLRRAIKRFYLDSVLREIEGRSIDFGCGAGQLLARLPPGSVGLEVNRSLVDALRANGLDARMYDANSDDFTLSLLEPGIYRGFVMAHVLEHFVDPAAIMHKLWGACARLGVETIVAIVPGAKGYASDRTHKTFIDERYIKANALDRCEGFTLAKREYFPGNIARIGDWFVFHELKLVYRRGA